MRDFQKLVIINRVMYGLIEIVLWFYYVFWQDKQRMRNDVYRSYTIIYLAI